MELWSPIKVKCFIHFMKKVLKELKYDNRADPGSAFEAHSKFASSNKAFSWHVFTKQQENVSLFIKVAKISWNVREIAGHYTLMAAPFTTCPWLLCLLVRQTQRIKCKNMSDETSPLLLPAAQSWPDPETSCSTRLHTDWWLGGTLWKDKAVFASRLSIDEMELFTFHNYYVHKP